VISPVKILKKNSKTKLEQERKMQFQLVKICSKTFLQDEVNLFRKWFGLLQFFLLEVVLSSFQKQILWRDHKIFELLQLVHTLKCK
jgi:hypothetical protein